MRNDGKGGFFAPGARIAFFFGFTLVVGLAGLLWLANLV